MSIVSSICAEADLNVVKAGILRAKSQARGQMVTDEYAKTVKILDDLQKYCEERINE